MTLNSSDFNYTSSLSQLIGGRITSIIVDNDPTEEDPGLPYLGFIVQVGDQSFQVVSHCDIEGNGAGHLEVIAL